MHQRRKNFLFEAKGKLIKMAVSRYMIGSNSNLMEILPDVLNRIQDDVLTVHGTRVDYGA